MGMANEAMYGEVQESVIIALPVKSATGPLLVVVKAEATCVTIEVVDMMIPEPPPPVEPA